jgi:hypothetical protein
MNVVKFPKLYSLDAKAERIRILGKQTIDNVIEIGKLLTECKDEVGHGHFGNWLKREFDWTERTAQRFMNVRELIKSNPTALSDFNWSSITLEGVYLLAAPSNIDIRKEVIEQVAIETKATGKHATHKTVKQAVKKARVSKPKKTKTTSKRRVIEDRTVAMLPNEEWEAKMVQVTQWCIGMDKLWTEQFGDWRKFEMTPCTRGLIEQCAETWNALLKSIKSNRTKGGKQHV